MVKNKLNYWKKVHHLVVCELKSFESTLKTVFNSNSLNLKADTTLRTVKL